MEAGALSVVIADNNVQDCESKEKTMREMGMNVILATGNGNKALEAIRTKQPDVVVMDMILPGLDGIGILEEINNDHTLKKRPVFLIETALRMENLVSEAIQAGADYYMMKPVSHAMLIKRIMQLMEKEEKVGSVPVLTPKFEIEPAKETVAPEIVEEKKEETVRGYHFSGDLEMDITNILLEIGIPAHIKGYQYIREGIIMSFYDRNMLHYITKFLYPTVAQKYKTTSSSVERTIRHAIEIAWRRGSLDTLEEFFGNSICAVKGKPTNSEFMALLTDKLRLVYRGKQVSQAG